MRVKEDDRERARGLLGGHGFIHLGRYEWRISVASSSLSPEMQNFNFKPERKKGQNYRCLSGFNHYYW